MKQTTVQKLYHLGHARWYDVFRFFWTRTVERKLEQEFLNELQKVLAYNKKANIVELGCGTGINIERLLTLNKSFASYFGIDFSNDMQAIAKEKFGNEKNIFFVSGDLRTISVPKKIDLVISTWVMSHLERPSLVIERFYENLNKGGTILLVFMTKPEWFISWWFTSLTKLFACSYIPAEEIYKMPGKKEIKRYAHGLATFIIIKEA